MVVDTFPCFAILLQKYILQKLEHISQTTWKYGFVIHLLLIIWQYAFKEFRKYFVTPAA